MYKHLLYLLILLLGCSCDSLQQESERLFINKKDIEFLQEGGEVTIQIGSSSAWSVSILDNADNWLTVTPSKGQAGDSKIKIKAKSTGVERTAKISIKSEESEAQISIVQSLYPLLPIGRFQQLEPSDDSKYQIRGKVGKILNSESGIFWLSDATGSIYVYGCTSSYVEANDMSFASSGIRQGDILTLVGSQHWYNGELQFGGNAFYVSHEGYTEVTISDFLEKEISDEWYKLTGTISNITNFEYGDFYLVDETGSVYVYGLTYAPVKKNDQTFSLLGLNEGDLISIIGKRAEYEGVAQVGGPAYILYIH